jgi:tetratricopeptide (TPR) repeat protein
MERSYARSVRLHRLVGCVILSALAGSFCRAQSPSSGALAPPSNRPTPDSYTSETQGAENASAEEGLRTGTALTRRGRFSEAIPYLLAARGRVGNEYAAGFNLALCYVGTGTFSTAVTVLNDLRRQGYQNADVENLLAQAYVGSGQANEALASLEKAAAISPRNEKLYLYVADACRQYQNPGLALKVVSIGLRNLPQSPRLHYERGVLLSQLDEFDRAKGDFVLVAKFAAGTEIGYVSAAEQALFDGNVPGAVQSAREGTAKGFQGSILLTILGEALLRSGATPGQPEFDEAQAALEKAVAETPNDPSAHLALGRLYLAAGRARDAIIHLEKTRRMEPGRLAVYSNLAKAYQRNGDEQAAQQALAMLEKLNLARAEQIRNAPGDRKTSYGGEAVGEETPHP